MHILWVCIMASCVNGLLLAASGRFLSAPVALARVLLGAAVGAALTGFTLLPGLAVTQTFLWRLLTLTATGLVAFGCKQGTGKKLILFSLLHLSLGGLSATQSDHISMVIGATGICLACFAVGCKGRFVPVRISLGENTYRFTALRDTGNTLTDPITGRSVLIIDETLTLALTGLTAQQLKDPVYTMQKVPGLRLIPYRTIDGNGFLLAKKMEDVCIGTWQGSTLVAFSHQKFGSNYQALTGGRL